MKERGHRARLIEKLSAEERRWQLTPEDWLKEKDIMADDKTKVGGQDRNRINIHEEYEIRAWTKSLGVTEEELRKAVAAVGDQADKVRERLGKK